MKKTFAQLKKDLQVGVKVKTVLNNIKPERNGEIRTIGKVQTNAIAFNTEKGLSWLWWPKASEIEYEDNTIKVYDKWNDEHRTLAFVYEIV